MTPATLRRVAVLAVAGTLGVTSLAAREITEVPRPVLDNVESAVRDQMVEARAGLDEAIEAFESGTIEPGELAASFGAVGQLYYLNDLAAAAEACFVNASRLDPEVFEWHYFLGALYPGLGRPQDAETHLLRAVELRPGYPAAEIRLGQTQLELGKTEEARIRFETVLAGDPGSAAAEQGLARLDFDAGRFESAIAHFERALELQPEANLLHYQLGLAYRELGDRERALVELKQNRHQDVRFDDPVLSGLHSVIRSAKLHFNSAIELLEQERPELAIEQLRLAIEKQPDHFTYHHNLAAALATVGREDDAIVEYQRALEINPSYPNSHFNLALMLVNRGDIRQAARHLELAHEHDPEDLVSHTEWATALSRLGASERAERELLVVLEKDPTYGKALLNLATVQAQLGRPTDAEATLAKLLTGDPSVGERAAAYFRLGKIEEHRGDLEVAMDSYRRAIEIEDRTADAHVALAGSLARQRAFAEAAPHYARAAELDSDDLGAHFGNGLALILSDQTFAARQALEESVELHPTHLPLVHLLARLLATAPDDRARDGARALELAQRVFSERQTLDHAETLAMAFAESGDFGEAVRWQRDILARASNQPAPPAIEPLRERLAQYERGEPVRAPWRN